MQSNIQTIRERFVYRRLILTRSLVLRHTMLTTSFGASTRQHTIQLRFVRFLETNANTFPFAGCWVCWFDKRAKTIEKSWWLARVDRELSVTQSAIRKNSTWLWTGFLESKWSRCEWCMSYIDTEIQQVQYRGTQRVIRWISLKFKIDSYKIISQCTKWLWLGFRR